MNIEELIFNMYKDECIGARKLREIVSKKYKLSDIEISNIYARINNYQINKYGDRISANVEFLSTEECQKRAFLRKVAKYQKKKRR